MPIFFPNSSKSFFLFFTFLLCSFLLFFHSLLAQQPAYFILGEKQFRGVQIYNVIQDKKLNYWFATNEGIFYYDYHSYQKIECDKTKSNAVFNFVMNEEGIIYCHNLNNQIFQIKGKECKLFYELNNEHISTDISLNISDDGNLVIVSKKIIVLNNSGITLFTYGLSESTFGIAYKAKNKMLLSHILNIDSVITFSKGSFIKHKIRYLSGQPKKANILKFFSIKNNLYAIDLKTKNTYFFDDLTFELTLLPVNPFFEKNQTVRIYETPKGLWIAGSLPSVAFLSHNLEISNTSIFYGNYFISNVYEDKEGNTLLSTFDKGVLVIPDLKVPDVIHSFKDDLITSIYADTQLGLVLGSSKGVLSNYSKNIFNNINKTGKRPIEGLYGDENSPLILFDDGLIRAYNKQTNQIINIIEASLKDAVFVSATEFYLATNKGIIKGVFDKKNSISIEMHKKLNFRVYALEYNAIQKMLYTTTSDGLFSVDSLGIIKKITYKNQDIFSKHLHCNNGKLYVPMPKSGILIIEKNNVTDSIIPKIAEKPEELNKIIIFKNSIIAKSSNGFFQFDMKGKLLKSFHTIFGFSAHRTIDFAFEGNNLWVSHSGGVQQIDLNYKNLNQLKPLIRLNEILINDEIISFQTPKTTPITSTTIENYFDSNQRKIQFTFSSPTLRNSEIIQYHYKLIGYDTKWNVNDYLSNQIIYSALAAGDYTFLVKVENQGVFSDVVSYSFNISKPIYAKWWFITISITFFLILVLTIYLWQLGVQRKKSKQINELNASKLAAIQSQMNPHFIFNALNSIQDLVLKGDVEQSYSYITTFSNLVRRTLNYSEKDFIDFEQEMKLLELYLTLEKLRFKKDLTYKIINANFEDIMLPPLLIQPFIENSLLHGLLHKEGKKELIITFELKENLICTIEDNGIGREKSKAIKNRQNQNHESFSGKAIHKRFEILSGLFKGNFGYHYEDLYQNNQPSGTKVILNIPVKRKF